MSDSHTCDHPGCRMGPYPTSEIARKHRYRYHSVPIPFMIDGHQYIVGRSDGRYACPLPECGKIFKKRENTQAHITADHNRSVRIKVFGTPEFISETPSNQAIGSKSPSFDADAVNVPLLPSVDYLESNEVLDALGLCMHSRLKVLLCYSCRVALTSGMVAGHRKNHHHSYQVPSAALQAVLDFCSEYTIYEKRENVKLPTAGGPPVQLVADPSDGFTCTASPDCFYSVKDLSSMQRHGREKHGTTRLVEIRYRPCQVQRIFTAVRNSYFEIGQNVIPGARPDIRTTLQATFLPTLDIALVVPAETERERTPLTRFMGWDKFLEELRMNPTQRRAAEQIKKKHTDDESGGIITRLAATVRDHMARASTILDGHPHRLSLSKLLLYGDSIPRDTHYAPSDTHWRPVSDDNVDYPNFMVQLMRAIVRIHLGSPLEFSFSLSTVQTTCLEELLVVLRNDNTSPRRRMIAYHNLAWSLVDTDPDLCVVDRWANPIKRAIWLRALRADGNFCEASFLTPDLAKLKYFCNITSLLEALMDKDEDADAVHFDDHDRVIRIHERVLRLGRTTTFNIVYEMQQYASSVVFNQTREPNVYVDPDVKSITIGTNTMHMDMLRDGIQRLLLELKSRYSALTNDNVVLKEVPEQVKDDLTNSTRGYSLASEEPFYKKRHALFLYLVDHYDLAMVDNAGRVAWNIPGIKELLRRSFRVWEPLYHLLYITTHISCRGTQFIDHKVSNADRHRNLFMQGNEMFLLTGYSKKTGITDRDSCTPGFVPKEVAFWALELLAGGLRTAEAILAGVAFGPQAEHVYRTYLCVGEGERISPTMFSANIQQWNNEYFQCRWGVRDFRQGAITMGREFIAPDESYDQADNILAESADHSTGMDHSHYAVIQGVVPRLSNNSMCKHRWLGDQWHSVLGLGPFPPPEAIRISRKNLSNGTSVRSISDHVKKIMEETLRSFFDLNYSEIQKAAVSIAVIKQREYALQPTSEIPSLPPSNWNGRPISLDSNLDDLFYNECGSILPAPAQSSGTSGYNQTRSMTSVVALSPTASGYIQCGSMLSDSPLPASSVESFSRSEYMDGLLPLPDIFPPGDQPESIPVQDLKGKGRAYEQGQRRPSNSRAYEPGHPGSSSSAVRGPTRNGKRQYSVTSTTTAAPVAPTAFRVRKHALQDVLESDEELTRSPKRIRRVSVEVMRVSSTSDLSSLDNPQLKRLRAPSTTVNKAPMEIITLPSDDDESSPDENIPIKYRRRTRPFRHVDSMSSFAAAGGSQPSSPPSAVRDIREEIRRAIRHIRKDDAAREKSTAQMNVLIAVMTADTDLVVTDEDRRRKKHVVDGPLGNGRGSEIYCPRLLPWKNLAQKFSKMSIKIVLMTGSGPPCRIANLINPFGMKRNLITEIRSSTNRPEIGMHVVHLHPIAAKQSLVHLVAALSKRLAAEERILVFCGSQGDAEGFALQAKCAVYHSDLWEAGNTRESNLNRWDSGETKVMACTTAFAQGMDRPHVRYVVIFKPSYGLIVNNQMLGRAGRDGKESHVFFLTDRGKKASRGPSTDRCMGELDELVYGTQCRRFTNMLCMDGENLAVRCPDDPSGIYCDVCDPESVMQRLAMEAIESPLRPLEMPKGIGPPVSGGSSLQGPIHDVHSMTAVVVPASTLPQTEIVAQTPSELTTQSSDALYDQDASELTSFEVLMLNAMEDIHGPSAIGSATGPHMTTSQPYAGSTLQRPLGQVYAGLERQVPSSFWEWCCVCSCGQPHVHYGVWPSDAFVWKGEKCPFAGIIFKAVFCMWHNEGFRQLMIKEMGGGASLVLYDQFLAWIVQDSSDPGRYNNLVEVFLWFCSGVEKVNPKFFD
ncbi:hypothetical protein DFJ58DRAFT_848448 [Suillus subalutaceus]|uniref:uncharacterized protein n=1 Tax=Suillus subalutaceus TaxID=48586 RepID=UPI001B86B363|nr:uncharacterized protein DFJ58DRAFT_848448 [Suillus subalutaceus]KAG1830498.1 hypothetical protein DFJ58DRAFT_848448 [Suillus subalutaceus]